MFVNSLPIPHSETISLLPTTLWLGLAKHSVFAEEAKDPMATMMTRIKSIFIIFLLNSAPAAVDVDDDDCEWLGVWADFVKS